MRERKHGFERGQILIMFGLSAGLMLAVMGLVFDGGRLYFEKTRMQGAADAGALAANWEQQRRNLGMVDSAGKDATKLNGFEHGVKGVDVEVNPAGGDRSVEVVISQSFPSTFMRVVGWSSSQVSARAVASLVAFGDACVIGLERKFGIDAIQASGGGTISSDCGVLSNSDLRTTGNGIMTSSWIGAAGNATGDGYLPLPEENLPPLLDPLAHIPEPNFAGWPNGVKNNATSTYECPSGQCVFDSQIKITGGAWTFQPGIYALLAGFSVTGGDITGSELMFYNYNIAGSNHVELGGNGTITLSPKSSGIYKGILFFGSRSSVAQSPGNKLGRGNNASVINGIMYFPNEHVDWAGTSTTNGAWSMLIANTINVSGEASLANPQFTLPDPAELPDITRPMLTD
jgi:hypothetical protein